MRRLLLALLLVACETQPEYLADEASCIGGDCCVYMSRHSLCRLKLESPYPKEPRGREGKIFQGTFGDGAQLSVWCPVSWQNEVKLKVLPSWEDEECHNE